MKIHPNSTLIMIGDSITEWGRETPIREDTLESLGSGYVHFIHCLIAAADPSLRLQILNMGVGGNTVRELAARWENDVMAQAPDWLSIMIGINDVWRQFNTAVPKDQQISVEEFSGTLERLIATIRPRLQGLVPMTPYYIEPDRTDPMRAMMDRFGEEVRRLAAKFQAEFVDTQAAMDLALREYSPAELADDRVHVNDVGHMILARAFLKAVDYSW
ncbi:MAG: SGNH/GDSL hydrolase family protein [Anaerolineales bacterium]